MLSNLLIAGVKKAGTSSLFDYLAQHPDICPSSRKETGFFSTLLDRGSLPPLEEYERYFVACGPQRYRMEATPTYYYGGQPIISAIREALVDPHVVVTLRDPVARLWSHWRMKDRSGSSPLGNQTFDQYVDRCRKLERDGQQWLPENRGYAALSQGRYIDYLVDWLDSFGDRFTILFFEQWSKEPNETMVELCRWLGIEEGSSDSINYAVRNRGTSYKNASFARVAVRANRSAGRFFQRYPKLKGSLRTVHDAVNKQSRQEGMDPSIRSQLEEVYRDSNKRLAEELAGRGYSHLPPWASDPSPKAPAEGRDISSS